MLTYTPTKSGSSPHMNKKRSWLLLLLVFVWLWPGVLHHDLWTPGEPYLFTTVSQWQTSNWAVPTIFGEINWEASPLYTWLAVLCQHLFSPKRMDVYEAEPAYTGLLDADGNAIYRTMDKIGFL